MNSGFPEKDWKKLRSLKDNALDAVCSEIIEKIQYLISSKGKSHQTYLEIWKMLKAEDDKVAEMFDDLKRSSAILRLAAWRTNGVLSDEALNEFSNETRERVKNLSEIRRIDER